MKICWFLLVFHCLVTGFGVVNDVTSCTLNEHLTTRFKAFNELRQLPVTSHDDCPSSHQKSWKTAGGKDGRGQLSSPQFIICVFQPYSVPILSRQQSLFLLVNQLLPLLLWEDAKREKRKLWKHNLQSRARRGGSWRGGLMIYPFPACAFPATFPVWV